MGKKLFKVPCSMEVTVFIAADDAEAAEDMAEEAVREEYQENGFTRDWDCGPAYHVTKLEEIPKVWRGSFPYGDDPDDRTCRQVLDDYVPELPPLGQQLGLEGSDADGEG